MKTAIALLRGINVGGKNMISMSALRELLEGLGFGNVRTLLQSGNVVFETKLKANAQLEQLLDKEIRTRLRMDVDFFVRGAVELQRLIEDNPFPAEALSDPGRLIVLFLKKDASAENLESVRAAIKGRERVKTVGRHAYIVYPDGQGTSRLTNAVLERHIGRCTGRNWNTVLKLAALTTPGED